MPAIENDPQNLTFTSEPHFLWSWRVMEKAAIEARMILRTTLKLVREEIEIDTAANRGARPSCRH